ncbi:hypothetical protein RF11_07624 [Thelohanellus kitauei]|uniref:Uncharacterized protein n=1 Tax=Thelohanellus kitauei TaxID=669202 RepID=A0A0C2NFS0_THEKT|nr:hypothetical protein RF11_07624 [Thelohanellus kitauei]
MWKYLYAILILHPAILWARQCNLDTRREISHVLGFFQNQSISICGGDHTTITSQAISALENALKSRLKCDTDNFETKLNALLSNQEMPDAERQQLIGELIGSIYDKEVCRLKEQISNQLLGVPDHLVAFWFHKSPTSLSTIVSAQCTITGLKRDILHYMKIQNDPEAMEEIDDLVITTVRNHDDPSISTIEAVKQTFQGSPDHNWLAQSSLFPSTTTCLARVHGSHEEDQSQRRNSRR